MLPVKPIRKTDGWCDAPRDRNYNRPVSLPYPASSETLHRKDGLYDIVAVLDYNLKTREQGKGSAIFLHAARQNFGPTLGCVALRKPHLLRLLSAVTKRTAIHIGATPRPCKTHRGRRGLR